MNKYIKLWIKPALLAAAAFTFSACSVDETLSVTDPDIINPADVQSAAGAEAVRLGALARLASATSGLSSGTTGTESLFLLGGLFSDEWINGDSFIDRQSVDQRVIVPANSFLTTANRVVNRARLSAEQAVELLGKWAPNAPAYQVAEMYFIQAYTINLQGEHYCDGLVISNVVDGEEVYGSPITTKEAFTRALKAADDGLALITGTSANDLRVKYALQVTRGRILINLNRPTEAQAAVAGVPTTFAYTIQHSTGTSTNAFWEFNNNSRRYSVSTGEGTNGLNFALAADARVPVCAGGDTQCRAINVTNNRRDDLTIPVYVQMLWPTQTSAVSIIKGVDARMIEAEAQLRAGSPATALATLNAARTSATGLAPLTLQATAADQRDQLFRERAFWQFGRGHRTGDLRRLITQYSLSANSVFPVGPWHKGGNYGPDVNFPVPQAEQNNPNVPAGSETCINRNA